MIDLYAKDSEIVRQSEIYQIIDEAKLQRRLSVRIDAELWDRLRPAVQNLCGRSYRAMYAPWRSFMLDGIWIERESDTRSQAA